MSDDGEPVRSAARRRSLLLAGAGGAAGLVAVAGGGAAAALGGLLPGGIELRRVLGMTGPDGTVPATPAGPVRVDRVRSRARGREIDLVVMLPPAGTARDSGGTAERADDGVSARTIARLPVCLMLHGRGSDARAMIALGTPHFLAAAVRSGVPPFAIVAVDGGSATYWHRRTPGDDPQAMLREELPGWLRSRGLAAATGGLPSSVLGISMGGSGALQYALGRTGHPLDAIALLSPALFRSWPDARTTGGYNDQADWRAHEPLLRLESIHPPHITAALGVWCGVEDPFCPAARELAAITGADEAHFPAGAHTEGFWRRVMPDALTLLGDHSAAPGR